jgi:hypothetical protein
MSSYCVKCRKQTQSNDLKIVESKGRFMQKSACAVCGTRKSAFVKGQADQKQEASEPQKKRRAKPEGNVPQKPAKVPKKADANKLDPKLTVNQ